MLFLLPLAILIGLSLFYIASNRRRAGTIGGLNIMDPQVENGIFTFLSVTERPLEPDANGNAYCSYRGEITGPLIEPIEVFRREVRAFNTLWPEVGDRVPVAYIPGKVKSSWQFVNFTNNF